MLLLLLFDVVVVVVVVVAVVFVADFILTYTFALLPTISIL